MDVTFMPIDPTFGTNDYNKPKMLTNLQTYVNNILVLLFGKPGFYPSIPSIGMDIAQYLYKYEDEINTDEIKAKLISQCRDFLPEARDGSLDIYKTTYKERVLLIFKLPSITDLPTCDVAIGVTTNDHGEMVYNFIENDQTQIL